MIVVISRQTKYQSYVCFNDNNDCEKSRINHVKIRN